MYKILFCVEEKDFRRLVDISRHYAGDDLSNCFVFNKRGYTAELYKEKEINGVKCIIFGWTKYELSACNCDIVGINLEKDRLKKGYILMEFEDKSIANYKNRSKIPELAEAMNVNKIFNRDDFSIVFNEENKEEESEEEYE